MNATATFKTANAARYLAALCDLFSHRVTATYDAQAGHVECLFGSFDLVAGSAQLEITATAKGADRLELVIDVVICHLERFTFRENPNLYWHRPPDVESTE